MTSKGLLGCGDDYTWLFWIIILVIIYIHYPMFGWGCK